MKILISIFALLVGLNGNAQLRIDSNVQNEFDSLFSIQPKSVQDKRYIEGVDCFALLAKFEVDTINIDDFLPIEFDSSIKIKDIDPETGEELPNISIDSTKYNQWLIGTAKFQKDTLEISYNFGFLGGFGFIIKSIKGLTFGEYFEYSFGNNIYREKLSEIPSSSIIIKAKNATLVVSNIPKKLENHFYGKATIVTEPFVSENNNFKGGYIEKRCTLKVLFISKLTRN